MNSPQSGVVEAVTLADILAAQERIAEYVVRTPLLLSEAATDRVGLAVHVKLENLQRTGAFKARGAVNKISTLTPEERRAGLICASTGNHGLAVAYAAKRFGCRCIVVLPENANPHKTRLLQKLGAQIVVHGTGSDERQERVNELS